MYNPKGQEAMNLEQGSLLISKYEQIFVSLPIFVPNLHLPNSILTKIFEDHRMQVKGREVLKI